MSIFRLLPFSLLIAAGAATLAAQSSPEKNAVVVQSAEPGQPNSSANTDLLSPNQKAGLTPPNAMDRIRIGEYRPRLNQFGLPHVWLVDPDAQALGDNVCYSMRSYKVARDDPQSDSTHAAGYSTCQPAARFHVHTIEFRVPTAAP